MFLLFYFTIIALICRESVGGVVENLQHADILNVFEQKNNLLEKELLSSEDPECHMSTPQIIRRWGYPAEEHFAVTDDGYIIAMHRIPHGKNAGTNETRPVVLLNHGLMSSSACYVTNLPHQSLGFILADAGFDVWLGNARGNVYCKNHTSLSTKSAAFWAFSWQEMAEFDLPAMVDYILGITHRKSLHYVGHSEGSLVMFSKASKDDDGSFSEKIETFTALGPVARVGHITSPLRHMASVSGPMEWFFKLIGQNEFLANSWAIDKWTQMFCGSRLNFVCSNFLFFIADFDVQNLNKTRIPVYFTHTPAGTSVQNMLHFAQGIHSKQWQHYDWGSGKNEAIYGQKSPPLFDPKKVNIPVYAFYGEKDTLADMTDVDWLLAELPNVAEAVFDPQMDHLSYVWGLDANERVYKHIVTNIRKY